MDLDDQNIPLRDYEYLDEDRLIDYLTTLDRQDVQEVKETLKEVSGESDGLAVDSASRAGVSAREAREPKEDTYAEKRTITIMAKQSFTRLYKTLDRRGKIIKKFDKPPGVNIGDLSVGHVVEVTRAFSPSLSPMIDPLARVLEHYAKVRNDVLSRSLAKTLRECRYQKMLMVFKVAGAPTPDTVQEGRRESNQHEGSEVEGSSIVFGAEGKFVIRDLDDFEGDLTVCGKVQKVYRSETLSLLDYVLKTPGAKELVEERYDQLRIEYRNAEEEAKVPATNDSSNVWSRLRRSFLSVEDPERTKRERLEEWKRISRSWEQHVKLDETQIRSPAIIITPLAVYR